MINSGCSLSARPTPEERLEQRLGGGTAPVCSGTSTEMRLAGVVGRILSAGSPCSRGNRDVFRSHLAVQEEGDEAGQKRSCSSGDRAVDRRRGLGVLWRKRLL